MNIQKSILQTLAYYQIFEHPLTSRELQQRASLKGVKLIEIEHALNQLVEGGVVIEHQRYYFLEASPSVVNTRIEGEARAQKMMSRAKTYSAIIYFFPFIRAVFISGSLSKGTIPENADIDYFIITKKNRLWIARTMLVMFKRVFLFNSKRYFCTNYFIDEETLEIPDKNIFTATEVSTLIPMRGNGYYEQFLIANSWYKEFYPNLRVNVNSNHKSNLAKKFSRSLIEPIFFQTLAESLDKYFMRKTYQRWMRIYGKNYSDQEFELAFRSRRGTSKNHDKNYQKKVLGRVNKNFQTALKNMNVEVVNG